jgi:hypothetical protein
MPGDEKGGLAAAKNPKALPARNLKTTVVCLARSMIKTKG